MGWLRGSMGRGSHKQTCRQDRDMPRKRPTPRLQHRQPGLKGGQGGRGQGDGMGRAPGPEWLDQVVGSQGTPQGGGCWGMRRLVPAGRGTGITQVP